MLGELFSSGMFQSAYQQYFTKDGVSPYVAAVPFRFTVFFAVMLTSCLALLFRGKPSRRLVKLGLLLWVAGQVAASVYLPDVQTATDIAAVQSAFLTSCYLDAFLVRVGGGIFVGHTLARTPIDSSVSERWSLLLTPFVYMLLVVPVATPVQDFRSGAMTALATAVASAYCCLVQKTPSWTKASAPDRPAALSIVFVCVVLCQTYCSLLPFALLWDLLRQQGADAPMTLVCSLSLALGATLGSLLCLMPGDGPGRGTRLVTGGLQCIALIVWLVMVGMGAIPGVLMFFVGASTVAPMVAILRKGRTTADHALVTAGMLCGSLLLTVLRRTQVEFGRVDFGVHLWVGVGFSAALVVLGLVD